jgi:hypothetical protein
MAPRNPSPRTKFGRPRAPWRVTIAPSWRGGCAWIWDRSADSRAQTCAWKVHPRSYADGSSLSPSSATAQAPVTSPPHRAYRGAELLARWRQQGRVFGWGPAQASALLADLKRRQTWHQLRPECRGRFAPTGSPRPPKAPSPLRSAGALQNTGRIGLALRPN